MKKKVAVALCLAALATPASAEIKLPDKMLGYWCFTRAHYYPDEEFEPDTAPLVRARSFDGCANNGGARFWRHGSKTNLQFGRFEWRADCKISKIERIENKYRVSADCTADRAIFYTGEDSQKPQHETRFFEIWRAKPGLRWRESEFDSYECRVTEVVEEISTGKPKTVTPEYDLVMIEVAKNPPKMKVSHIDKKGNVAERNKQYRNGSYVLLSTDSTDTADEMASPVFIFNGSRTVGSTIYRIVGKMTLDGEGPLYYGYYEEIHKDGYLDATIRAGNCSERK
jgi:hypothetical protein